MRPPFIFSFAIALILLTIAFIRDLQYERLYPDDLRNRVVGARLIHDGISPYFYKWKQEDGMRYFDPENVSNTIISNTTASPFLHELLLPVCNFSQRTISLLWFFGQYAILIFMGLVAYRYAQGAGKHACLLVTAAFPFTDGWIRHILTGQFYLLIPFLLFIIYILLDKGRAAWSIALAALCAVMVVLIRPFAALFFVPLLFILPQAKKFILYSFAIGAAYTLFVVTNPFQLALYKDYNQYIKYAINAHQGIAEPSLETSVNPGANEVEGFDIAAIRLSKARDSIRSRNEHGNVFVVYKKIFNRQLPGKWLLVGSLFSTLLIILLFYFSTVAKERSLIQCMLIGFVVYLVLEIFLPTHRHQYNTVQFLFPLLLAGMYIRHIKPLPVALMLCGLLLNIIKWEIFPMKNTIGEILMLTGFLLAVISWKAVPLTSSHDNPAPY